MSSSHSTPTKTHDTLYYHCNLQCSVFTVRKEGKNRGRKFYCCPRWRLAGDCKFSRCVENNTCASDSYGHPKSKIEQGYVENLEEVGQLLRTIVEKIDYICWLQHLILAALAVSFLLMICFTIVLVHLYSSLNGL